MDASKSDGYIYSTITTRGIVTAKVIKVWVLIVDNLDVKIFMNFKKEKYGSKLLCHGNSL